jgi:hypothetical protein
MQSKYSEYTEMPRFKVVAQLEKNRIGEGVHRAGRMVGTAIKQCDRI